MTLLVSCQAPLDLERVHEAARRPLHRTDRLQAAAAHRAAIVVVGINGVVLRSPDAGVSWERTVVDSSASLIDVAACPDGTFVALALESAVWISRDTGRTWHRSSLPEEFVPQAMTCDPADNIWTVGGFTTLLRSADDGESWSRVHEGDDQFLTSIQFIDHRTGVALGEFGSILRTDDGGSNWVAGDPLPDDFYSQDAWFSGESEGWVAGLNGAILRTRDKGRTWDLQATETEAALYGLAPAGGTVYAVGNAGTLLRLEGGRWRNVEYATRARGYLRAALGIGQDRILIAGDGGELRVVNLLQ